MADQSALISCRKSLSGGKRDRSKIDGEDAGPKGFHMVLRSHVKKEFRSIATPLLPEDIIISILLLLPADILHNVMRYVCRRWRMIIDDHRFASTHVPQSTTSTFLVEFNSRTVQLMHVRDWGVGGFPCSEFQLPGRILSTCNGLLLACYNRPQSTHHALYYITNRVTNKMLTLPPFCLNVVWCYLTFAASSNIYKVVIIFCNTRPHIRGLRVGVAILAVGVDRAWRFIDYTHLDVGVSELIKTRPINNSGFLYWTSYVYPSILALDIESESMKTISCPKVYLSRADTLNFVPKENSVACFHVCEDFTVEVWVLKDYVTGDWVKLPDLRGQIIREEVERVSGYVTYNEHTHSHILVRPRCWLRNEEKIIIQIIFYFNHYFVYDIETGSGIPFIMDHFGTIIPHINSLAWV